MKKESLKRLSLSKETLRSLSENDLVNAAGGTGLTLPDSSSNPIATWSCNGATHCG